MNLPPYSYSVRTDKLGVCQERSDTVNRPLRLLHPEWCVMPSRDYPPKLSCNYHDGNLHVSCCTLKAISAHNSKDVVPPALCGCQDVYRTVIIMGGSCLCIILAIIFSAQVTTFRTATLIYSLHGNIIALRF